MSDVIPPLLLCVLAGALFGALFAWLAADRRARERARLVLDDAIAVVRRETAEGVVEALYRRVAAARSHHHALAEVARFRRLLDRPHVTPKEAA